MSMNDGMVIFCSRGSIMFSSSGERIVDVKKTRKHTKNRSIVHPIFEDMKDYCDSPYWNDILTKFSRNIFPRNFKFYNNTIYYKAKKKNSKEEFLVDKNNISTTFVEMKIFLEDKGILSTMEKKEKCLMDYREEVEMNKWKDFSVNQSFLVDDFIVKLANEYQLNEEQTVYLESTIRFGISCGVFNNDTIHVEEGIISKIDCLEWNDEEKKFYINKETSLPKFSGSRSHLSNAKSSRYSSHTFSGGTFCIRNTGPVVKLSEKWRIFLSDYYK